ncbi:MAG: hypothetical protein ABJA37_00665 [Ferruginibacter sp.]
MCNCGNKRDYLHQNGYKLTGNVTAEKNASGFWKDAPFKYTGKSGLTVFGGVTGKRYRFQESGEVILIDYRDVSGMRSVPVLRKI